MSNWLCARGLNRRSLTAPTGSTASAGVAEFTRWCGAVRVHLASGPAKRIRRGERAPRAPPARLPRCPPSAAELPPARWIASRRGLPHPSRCRTHGQLRRMRSLCSRVVSSLPLCSSSDAGRLNLTASRSASDNPDSASPSSRTVANLALRSKLGNVAGDVKTDVVGAARSPILGGTRPAAALALRHMLDKITAITRKNGGLHLNTKVFRILFSAPEIFFSRHESDPIQRSSRD